jgi:hypothetical protein
MKEVIGWVLVFLLGVLTMFTFDRQEEIKSLNTRIANLEEVAYTSYPRISIARGTVYAGSEAELIIEKKE